MIGVNVAKVQQSGVDRHLLRVIYATVRHTHIEKGGVGGENGRGGGSD